MTGSDGKEWMNLEQLDALRRKYVESKLDPDVLKDVSKDQYYFFMYPHEVNVENVKPEHNDGKQHTQS